MRSTADIRRVTRSRTCRNHRPTGWPACSGIDPGLQSGRGRDQSDPHIPGDIDADLIGKHAAIGNGNGELAAPDMAHADFVSRTLDVRRYLPPKLHLAYANRAALA